MARQMSNRSTSNPLRTVFPLRSLVIDLAVVLEVSCQTSCELSPVAKMASWGGIARKSRVSSTALATGERAASDGGMTGGTTELN